jgi:hypothetical protein
MARNRKPSGVRKSNNRAVNPFDRAKQRNLDRLIELAGSTSPTVRRNALALAEAMGFNVNKEGV